MQFIVLLLIEQDLDSQWQVKQEDSKHESQLAAHKFPDEETEIFRLADGQILSVACIIAIGHDEDSDE